MTLYIDHDAALHSLNVIYADREYPAMSFFINKIMRHASFLLCLFATSVDAQELNIKNIVLVHGAFTDGSSWSAVTALLQAKGYNVTAVQNPLTSLTMMWRPQSAFCNDNTATYCWLVTPGEAR
jgi:pimeloyl-ACP methyl ester carboxylesterase